MKKPVSSWVCSTGIYSDIFSLWTPCSSRKLHQDIKITDRSTAGTCPSIAHIDLFHAFSLLGHADSLLILTHELARGLTMSTSQYTVTSELWSPQSLPEMTHVSLRGVSGFALLAVSEAPQTDTSRCSYLQRKCQLQYQVRSSDQQGNCDQASLLFMLWAALRQGITLINGY